MVVKMVEVSIRMVVMMVEVSMKMVVFIWRSSFANVDHLTHLDVAKDPFCALMKIASLFVVFPIPSSLRKHCSKSMSVYSCTVYSIHVSIHTGVLWSGRKKIASQLSKLCYLPPASVGFQHSPQLLTCAMHSVHALVNMVFVVNIHMQLLTWPSCYRDINHMLKISN